MHVDFFGSLAPPIEDEDDDEYENDCDGPRAS